MREKIVFPCVLLLVGVILCSTASMAAGGKLTGPKVVAPDRDVYYPGTEILAEDEVRVVACGTGMPDQRRGQTPEMGTKYAMEHFLKPIGISFRHDDSLPL